MPSTSAPISAHPSTIVHALIRYGFAPLMLLGVNGITIWLAAEEVGVIVHILVILGAIAAAYRKALAEASSSSVVLFVRV